MTYTEFLQDQHAMQYTGIDDNMLDDFDNWCNLLSDDKLLNYEIEFFNSYFV